MKKIVLVGGGGHGLTILSIMPEELRRNVVGYVDRINKGVLVGLKYLGDEEFLNEKVEDFRLIIGFSYSGLSVDTGPRKTAISRYIKAGFEFQTVISEKATVHDSVRLGEGTVVFPGAIINQASATGKNCVINTAAVIEHDCFLHDNVQISPGAIVCGGVEIQNNCFIGAGAILRDSITIGPDIIIGMGTRVTKSIVEQGVYFTKSNLS